MRFSSNFLSFIRVSFRLVLKRRSLPLSACAVLLCGMLTYPNLRLMGFASLCPRHVVLLPVQDQASNVSWYTSLLVFLVVLLSGLALVLELVATLYCRRCCRFRCYHYFLPLARRCPEPVTFFARPEVSSPAVAV